MATIAFGLAGATIAGPAGAAVGGMIGAAVGSLVDNYLIFPALFPKPTMQGQRVDGIQVQTAAEGSDMKWVLGPENRVAGTVIWVSPLIEVAANSGGGKGGGPSATTYSYFVDIAIAICSTETIGAIYRIPKVWADTKVIYDGQPSDKYESIAIYDGSQTSPDPTIVAHEGSDTPNYKNVCYVVIKRIALADYGNRIPNFTFQVEQNPDVSVATAIGYVMQRAGFDTSEYDCSRIPDCFRGMVVTGQQPTINVLQALGIAYAVTAQQTDNKLIFFPRGAESEISVVESDLAAHEDSDTPRVLEQTDVDNIAIPSQVDVKFVSSDNDLQAGAERQRRINLNSLTATTLDLPITLSPVEGRTIAKRVLWVAEAERVKVRCMLPPSYIDVQEGDVLPMTVDGVDYRVYVSELHRGFNYIVEVDGLLCDPAAYTQDGVSQDPGSSPDSLYRPTATFFAVFDAVAVRDDLCDKIGLYYAVCALDPSAIWQLARLDSCLTVSGTYVDRGGAPNEAPLGVTTRTLDNGPVGLWDEQGSVDINLYQGSATSCSEDECLNNTNIAAFEHPSGEWEIVAFQIVTSIATNQYRLSRLIRGLRGTEHLVTGHAAGLKVVIIRDDSTINFYDRTSRAATGLGTNDYYKMPMLNGIIADYPPQRAACTGLTMRPFAPAQVRGAWDNTTNDFTLTWGRRAKHIGSVAGQNLPLALDEQPEKYKIEFRKSGFAASIKRTVTVSDAQTYTYTAADQASDGFTAGTTPIYVTIYQLSTRVGSGKAAQVLISP